MKSASIAVLLAPTVATAEWYNGAPSCAHNCLSSAWDNVNTTATSAGFWPVQSDYCDDNRGKSISSCLSKECSGTPTAISSYASLSTSLCSQFASCKSAGSTGVHTMTYSGGPVTWAAPGGWNKDGFAGASFGNGNGAFATGSPSAWSEWASAYSASATWTGGVVTVTGCVGAGSPWFVGPGCGWNEAGGFNGWVGWGEGWSTGSAATKLATFTNDMGSLTTATATVVAAVSGTMTTSIVRAAATNAPSGNSAARVGAGSAAEGSIVTGLMGLGLAAVVLVAGML